MSRIVLVNQSSTPDDAGSGNAQLFIEGNELYQQVGTGDKTKVANETTSTFTSSLSAPSVSAVNTAKAWCFWGQTASDHNADTSFNVSSVTDSGAGHSTINFATAMPTVNYVVATSYNLQGGYGASLQVTTKATGSCQLKSWYGTGGGATDATDCNAVFYSN